MRRVEMTGWRREKSVGGNMWGWNGTVGRGNGRRGKKHERGNVGSDCAVLNIPFKSYSPGPSLSNRRPGPLMLYRPMENTAI